MNGEPIPLPAETPVRAAPQQIGPLAYVVAMFSIMPGIGVLFGPLAVIWGLARLKRGGKPVAVIGAVGFGGQFLFFVFLIHKLFN